MKQTIKKAVCLLLILAMLPVCTGCGQSPMDIVDDGALKATGAAGVIRKGSGVQIVYGPQVAGIKTDLQEYIGRRTPSVE